MNLKIFYHIIDLPGYEDIVTEQIEKLEKSGVLDYSELYMCVTYINEETVANIQEKYKDKKIFKWVFTPNIGNCEFPTWILMQQTALASSEEFYSLYFHVKGISHIGHPKESPTTHWRWFIDYWAIENWKDCVSKLDDGYDAVGAGLSFQHGYWHFPGTTSWNTSKFLRQAKELKLPSDVNFQAQVPGLNTGDPFRCDVEFWYGYNNAKMFSMYDTNFDFYGNSIPPSLYRK